MPVRRGELPAALVAFGYFFVILAANGMLGPLRDALGVRGDATTLPWLFACTLAGMALINPLFSWVASRIPRRRFVPLIYHFFALCLLAFYGLLRWSGHIESGGFFAKSFYVWHSVFNLLAVSVFRALMADVWTTEQGTRLYGFIGLGGTLGVMAGSKFTAEFVGHVGPTNLLLIALVLLEIAALCAVVLARLFRIQGPANDPNPRDPRASRSASTGPFAGLIEIARSPYLLAICGYMLIFTITSTFLYFEQAKIVKATFTDTTTSTAALANITFWANAATIVMQLLFTAHVLRWFGIGVVLTLLPLVTMSGFVALAIWPVFATLMAVQIARRAVDYALAIPAREILYTVVTRDEKYKAKTFIDTFVYRGGDTAAAFASDGMSRAGLGLAAIAGFMAPLAVIWTGLGVYLGIRAGALRRAQQLRDLSIPSAQTSTTNTNMPSTLPAQAIA